MLNGLDKARVTDIFKSTFPSLNVRKYNTMAKMIAELCPPDETEMTAASEKAQKRKLEIAILDHQIKEAQGFTTTTHKVYDVFHSWVANITNMVIFDTDMVRHMRHSPVLLTTCFPLCGLLLMNMSARISTHSRRAITRQW
jgi:hypothetical protein